MSKITVGASAFREFVITSELIFKFSEVTGDQNPIHLDETYASQTRFGRRIAHGMLLGGFISAVFAEDIPGPGAVYLSQTFKFTAPAYIGDTVTAKVEAIAIREGKPLVTFRTTCRNQADELLLEGEAVLLLPTRD